MATTHEKKYQYSTSEIELRSTYSEERIASEPQLSTNAPLLESVTRGDPVTRNSEHGTYITDESVHSTALGCELSHTLKLEKQSELPRGWPTSPQAVKYSIRTLIWRSLVDVALFLLSVAFLVFALLVIRYNNRPTSSHRQAAQGFEQASKWGPTIYPILFASVVGRATHAVLLWRLGKGECIAILDILAGSTSLTSTVVSQLHLRMVSYIGLGLIAIWMLSPIGGQSSFRQISIGPKNTIEHAGFSYVASNNQTWTSSSSWKVLDAIYLAALFSPTTREGSPRDGWGHIKVPRVEYYEGISIPDEEGWYKTEMGGFESYSSFIGIPMSGMDSMDFTDYTTTIQAMYFRLDCDPYGPKYELTYNYSSWFGDVSWDETPVQSANVHAKDLNSSTLHIHWGIIEDYGHELDCMVGTSQVEVEVACPTYTTCSANRVRRSKIPQPPGVYMLMEKSGWTENTTWELIITSQTELWSWQYISTQGDVTNWQKQQATDLTPETYAIRLSQMLSAYWMAMTGKSTMISRFGENTTLPYDPASQNDTTREQILRAGKLEFAKTWSSTGTKRSNIEVFHAHYHWAFALIVSSVVLIAASLIPPYIRTFLSHGPDILMNLSSLAVRDNPYVALPATGTYLDAADRSRYLKDLRIRYGDVGGEGEVGRLAIGRVDRDVEELRKGRKYM